MLSSVGTAVSNGGRLALRAVVATLHSRGTAHGQSCSGGGHARPNVAPGTSDEDCVFVYRPSASPGDRHVLLSRHREATAAAQHCDGAALQQRPVCAVSQQHSRAIHTFRNAAAGEYVSQRHHSKSLDSEQTSDSDVDSCTSAEGGHSARMATVRCGFNKDLTYGKSSVLDSDSYGEDACFVARHKNADVIGVADGVGGWSQRGVDPSRFPIALMRACGTFVKKGLFDARKPAKLLAEAYEQLQAANAAKFAASSVGQNGDWADTEPLIGSSTACIVVLERVTSRLYTANLGDSGFVVVRDGKVVHGSEEQTHYFNAPFQISMLPEEMKREGFISDSPWSAETGEFAVRHGDVIMVATDGLFDNMPMKMIETHLAAVAEQDGSLTSLQAACNSICLMARRLSLDAGSDTPFARKAAQHGFMYQGGKPDDITVLLVMVKEGTE